MRVLLITLACACLLAAGCAPSAVFEDASACIPPADPGSQRVGSLPALVDRADVIALVRVTKAERTYTGYRDRIGARRLTLDAIDTAKGAAPKQFVVDDGPCPMFAATEGDSFVALLEYTPDGNSLKPVGLPTSGLRATPARSLPQLMSEIRSIRPLDGEARALFERYGWRVTAKQDFAEFELPPLAAFGTAGREITGAAPSLTQPLQTYTALSQEVGLDPRPYAGQRVERLSFWLERTPPEYAEGTPFGHVLIAERHIAAAWVTIFPEGGPFSVRDRASALASPRARPPFPPPNRFPAGVNVARTYGLTEATSISFKTSDGGNDTITDPSQIQALAAALDTTLPTAQATWDPNTKARQYYLSVGFEGSYISLVYDVNDGVLSVLADGYAVKPGAAFASVIAGLR